MVQKLKIPLVKIRILDMYMHDKRLCKMVRKRNLKIKCMMEYNQHQNVSCIFGLPCKFNKFICVWELVQGMEGHQPIACFCC